MSVYVQAAERPELSVSSCGTNKYGLQRRRRQRVLTGNVDALRVRSRVALSGGDVQLHGGEVFVLVAPDTRKVDCGSLVFNELLDCERGGFEAMRSNFCGNLATMCSAYG